MNAFKLEIITPENQFFDDYAEAVILRSPSGELEVLAGHQNMVTVISDGILKIKKDGNWHKAVISSGFGEVRPDEVVIFTDFCEWEENAASALQERERELNEERIRHEAGISKQKLHKIEIARTVESFKESQASLPE